MHVGNKLVVNTVGWGCIIFLVSSYMEHNIFVFLVYFETKCRTTQTLGLILVWGILIVTSPRGSPARDNTYVKYGANLVLFFSCLDKVHKQALSNGLKLSASLIPPHCGPYSIEPWFLITFILQQQFSPSVLSFKYKMELKGFSCTEMTVLFNLVFFRHCHSFI